MSHPVTLDITFKNMLNAENLALLPNIQRVDGATIRFVGKDMVEVMKFISFATNYDAKE